MNAFWAEFGAVGRAWFTYMGTLFGFCYKGALDGSATLTAARKKLESRETRKNHVQQ